MRIKVSGIIRKTVGTIMTGITGISRTSIVSLGRRASLQGVIVGARISMAHVAIVIMQHNNILILVCSVSLIMAARTLAITVYPASSYMIGMVASIGHMTAYTWVGGLVGMDDRLDTTTIGICIPGRVMAGGA
jgi:hypothetical protein